MDRRNPLVGLCVFGILVLAGCQRSAKSDLAVADELLQKKQYQDASLNYRKAIQKDAKLGEAYYGLGLAELELGNGTVAFESIRQAAQLLPDRVDVKVKLADLMLAAYQQNLQNRSLYDALRKVTDELSAKDKESFDALRMNGNLALLDRRAGDAIGFFKKANTIKPMQEYLVLGYAQALIDNGQAGEAEELGRQLIAQKKDFGPMYNLLYRTAVAAKRESAAEEILKLLAANNPGTPDAAIQLAAHYVRTGNQQAMQSTLQAVLDARPAIPKGHLAVGDFYLRLRQLDQALQVYEQGAKSDSVLQVRIASVRLLQKRTEEALAILNDVLSKSPSDSEAAMLKADILLDRGRREDTDTSIALYNGILKSQPRNGMAKLNLGRAYLIKGDLASSRKYFQEAAQLSPGDDTPGMLLATANIMDNKPADAMTAVDQVMARQPKDARARFLKFAALMQLKRYDEARPILEQLVVDYPRSRDLRLQQGLLAIATKRYKEAESHFNRLANEKYDATAVAGLAEAYMAQQQFDRAMKVLSDEVRKEPKANKLRLMMAKTAMQAGKYDQALREFERLSATYPKNPLLALELGNAYREKGDLPKAIETLQSAVQLNSKDPTAHLALGMALYAAGKNEGAISSYRQALALQPANATILNNLAYSLAESGTGVALDEALRFGQKAVQLNPNELDYKDTLGWVYLKRQNVDSAIQIFQALCKEKPTNPSYQHHLGAALAARNDIAGARKALMTALRNEPTAPEAAQIRKQLDGLAGR